MKLIYLFLGIILISTSVDAQEFKDLDKSPMDAVITRNEDNSPLARIIYSRPKKKNREIFGKLVPYGEVWRTGANEATEITFYEDVLFNGEKIDAGTYTLFTIPNKKQWEIIINEKINTWGTNYDEDLDVIRTKVETRNTAATVEDFSITFKPRTNGSDLLMGWDDVFIQIPITKI
ncbi:DUF2911 domain-containing protein [Psychroflexus aestuariivivens]|uniref:DUF2911 domain-containing protein n=1 Tax=Psychroflexus aestuariivivens TaxID=1795040 RepID=UPI000FD9B8C3|nr:DUF2911 domain-containing protein [Psychroflexus aestuariivivens]